MNAIRPELLAMLRCPEQRTPLALLDDATIAELNSAIAAGRLKNRGGELCEKTLDGALVREDRTVAYPIVDGIPILLVDESILLDQISSS